MHKISPESSEYKDSVQEAQEGAGDKSVYGKNVLHAINSLRSIMRFGSEENNIEWKEKVEEKLNKSQQELLRQIKQEDTPAYKKDKENRFSELFSEAFSDELFINFLENNNEYKNIILGNDLIKDSVSVKDGLNKIIKENTEEYKKLLQNFTLMLINGEISPLPFDMYERLLIIHGKEFNVKQKEFSEKVPKLKEDFFNNSIELINKGSFPIDTESLKQRIDMVVFYFNDSLTGALKERWGSYSDGHHAVYIGDNVPNDIIKWVFFHEMLHAISGQTIVGQSSSKAYSNNGPVESLDTVPENSNDIFFNEQRVGLSFHIENKPELISRFDWLNEAVTEDLNGYFANKKGGAYSMERQILYYLVSGGKKHIPFKLFKEAYFENFEPKNKEKIPAWKELYKEINDAFEPNYLLKLDKLIKEKGLKEVIKILDIINKNKKQQKSQELLNTIFGKAPKK
jgi:hypothetical protein